MPREARPHHAAEIFSGAAGEGVEEALHRAAERLRPALEPLGRHALHVVREDARLEREEEEREEEHERHERVRALLLDLEGAEARALPLRGPPALSAGALADGGDVAPPPPPPPHRGPAAPPPHRPGPPPRAVLRFVLFRPRPPPPHSPPPPI